MRFWQSNKKTYLLANQILIPFITNEFTVSSKSDSSQSEDEIELSKQIFEINLKYEHNERRESGVSTESSPLKRQLSEELFSKKNKFQKQAFTGYLKPKLDESFEKDSKTIQEIEINYKADAAQVTEQLASIIATASKFIDLEKLTIDF